MPGWCWGRASVCELLGGSSGGIPAGKPLRGEVSGPRGPWHRGCLASGSVGPKARSQAALGIRGTGAVGVW